MLRLLSSALVIIGLSGLNWASANEAQVLHALAMHGEPKYGSDFQHLDYANPDAPKGGTVRLAAIGTFDSLNPFTLKGVAVAGIGNIFDTLTVRSDDEAFTEYGLIAETIEVPEDRSYVAFKLRPEARFHDGQPITVEDVIFTLNTLKTDGHPFFRAYYANVEKAEKIGERTVKFSFSGGENRELPLIIGQMNVLPKHYWANKDFTKTTLDPLLGSGPYKITAVDPGRSITYELLEDYWAKDLPIMRGKNNFGTIRYDYYRDQTVALEALKAGEYDFRSENTSKLWATGYDSPALEQGWLIKEEIAHQNSTGMQGFVFNTRRDFFKDPKVRQALAYAFDFEWTNKTLFYGAYTRTHSFFSNSELAATGLPSAQELEILEPFRDQLPEEVFTQVYEPPTTDGSGKVRSNLRVAFNLLKEAGWRVKNKKLTHAETGQAMVFEILLVSPAFERIVLPFKKNLERLGIDVSVRTVDVAQYQKRAETFDFDMMVGNFGQSLSPGNEQRDFWGSEKADVQGSRNIIGIKNPVIDHLIDSVISAPDRDSLITRTRALDRVLLWNHYVIPQYHIRTFRVAYWNKFSRPAITPKHALGFNTWWVDPDKQKALDAARNTSQ